MKFLASPRYRIHENEPVYSRSFSPPDNPANADKFIKELTPHIPDHTQVIMNDGEQAPDAFILSMPDLDTYYRWDVQIGGIWSKVGGIFSHSGGPIDMLSTPENQPRFQALQMVDRAILSQLAHNYKGPNNQKVKQCKDQLLPYAYPRLTDILAPFMPEYVDDDRQIHLDRTQQIGLEVSPTHAWAFYSFGLSHQLDSITVLYHGRVFSAFQGGYSDLKPFDNTSLPRATQILMDGPLIKHVRPRYTGDTSMLLISSNVWAAPFPIEIAQQLAWFESPNPYDMQPEIWQPRWPR